MGSHIIKVLRQGVWGSLTGGWYYEPRHSKFTNVFHLYAWLVLLCLPFCFYLAFEPSWAVVGSYLAAIFTIYFGVKLTNYHLHLMFDNGEVVNRKEVSAEGQRGDADQLVEESNANQSGENRDQSAVAVIDAFPVAGSGDALKLREDPKAEGEETPSEHPVISGEADHNRGDKDGQSADRPIRKRDLEVDVHRDSTNVKFQNRSPVKETAKATAGKNEARKGRRKAVNFVDPKVSAAKPVNIGRCASLSSASNDDGDLTDETPSYDTGSSSETNSNDIRSSDEEEIGKGSEPTKLFRSTNRFIKRRAGIRGHTKHPWYQKAGDTSKTFLRQVEDDEDAEYETSVSSSCSDESQKEVENNNHEKGDTKDIPKSGITRAPNSLSERKRVCSERPSISPQRKQPTSERASSRSSLCQEDTKPTKNLPIDGISPGDKETPNLLDNDMDVDRDMPTSDQELLARDPVWRARRSVRYSSDRRPFFRRRSYTVNPNRLRHFERDSRRRCLSTVPPYGGHRDSSTRVTTSSLQKLWNMWARDPVPSWTHGSGASSPGQVSPGEVPVLLTSRNIEPSMKAEPNRPKREHTRNRSPERGTQHSKESGKSYKPEAGDSLGVPQHKVETSSRNSNPHCNEVSMSGQAGGDHRPMKSQERPRERERRARKAKRKRVASNPTQKSRKENSDELKTDDTLGVFQPQVGGSFPLRASTPGLLQQDYDEGCDSEEDMNKFIHSLLGAADTWQAVPVADPGPNDPNQEMRVKPVPTTQLKRKLSQDNVASNRDETAIQVSSLNMASEPASEFQPTRRPRRSLPTLPLPTAGSIEGHLSNLYQRRRRARLSSRASAPPSAATTAGSRRVRHPAGNGNVSSHSRLTSNTSEEGGVRITGTTLQQLSANSLTSTAELLSNHDDQLPMAVIEKLEEAEELPGIHIATEHNDTTAGAIHAFQDEHGNWLTYTFGESSQGVATSVGGTQTSRRSGRTRARTLSSRHSAGDSSDSLKSVTIPRRDRPRINLPIPPGLVNRRHRSEFNFNDGSDGSGSFTQPSLDISPLDFILNGGLPNPLRPVTPRVKLYYKFNFFPCKSIILQYDRLALHDLLDRNRLLIENVLATALAMVVALLGFLLLWRGFFLDIWPLWFCAVIASCQYSLIRSVQPDAASPMHGHNRVIAYSRPIYFSIVALLILLFDFLAGNSVTVPNSYLYAGLYFTQMSCVFARDILIVLIMLLPVIFLLGLLPQINTFVTYTAEQFDIHMFGGTACTGLTASLYSLARSIIACCCLFGFCYGGMQTKENSQHILFSIFCGLLVSFSYHLSRQTTNPVHLWRIIKSKFFVTENRNDNANTESGNNQANEKKEENPDDLSQIYVQHTLSERLQSDLIVCPLIAVFMFAIHCSTAFKVLQPTLSLILYIIAGVLGVLTHYILPQLRKQLPWLLFSSPILKTKEYNLFEVEREAQVMWFEKMYIWFCYVERNILYPIVILNEVTRDAPEVISLYGLAWGSVILTFVSLKLLRSAYNITLLQFVILAFSALFTEFDARSLKDPNIITYFLVSIFFVKLQDLMLKLQFILVYVAPWQITWGSAFHAFAQPFSVPHSGMLLLHTVVSSLLHAPLAPFLGSAVFLTSYVRPLKFWERNYNTKRVDHSNTRLASQIDRGPSSDDNNLNSIFYEHLTLSLQKSLCGDIAMGRWGNVYPGDCFIMASDYLNAFVHVIQRGNGVITFQLRGLEFSGTYCQQREVEAISEGADDNFGFCCFRPGHMKNMLSLNSAFNQRWLAWQVQATKYVLDGYSITENSATSMLGVYDLRKILISYIVKSVIYFLVSHKSLEKWLEEETIIEATRLCEEPDYVDIDTNFSVTVHDDYDMWLSGISRNKFHAIYGDWIEYCSSQRDKPADSDKDSKLVSFCFLISVLSRRALGTASNHLTANHVVLESFLYGLHSLFKGDFRITSPKDEWVFTDMDLLHHVVAPGVRMSLKLHQDHFQSSGDEDNLSDMYDVVSGYVKDMVITHEADPQWRKAVLSNRNSLLTLRHVAGDAVDSYFVIALKRRSLAFRVVRVNKECVKGLWAGQQQELVFLRNRNPERGSIQNAKQVLRNMINSSCDQPIGYPIYVSPVTTSFSNTHPQYKKIVGGSMTIHGIRRFLSNMWSCLQQSCGGGCNSGGSAGINVGGPDITRFRPSVTHRTANPPTSHQTAVRTSVTGSSHSGSNQSNLGTIPISPTPSANPSEQVTITRMLRASDENRRHTRSNTDDFTTGNILASNSTITGGRSSRLENWCGTYDGSKSTAGRHPSAGASIEMSPINSKFLLPPSLIRNYRNSGGESSCLPIGEVIFPQSNQRTSVASVSEGGRKIHKSASALAAISSSSSSMSKGDSLTLMTGQSAPSTKSLRKSSSGKDEVVTKSKKTKGIPFAEKSKKEIVMITDPSRIFKTLDVCHRPELVKWPNEDWRKRGGKSKWGDWMATSGTTGEVVFRWYASHRNPALRSHIGENILLLSIENPMADKKPFYVPIPESCVTLKPDTDAVSELETTQL